MHHEQLWAPWRLAYIKEPERAERAPAAPLLPEGDAACFICRAAVEPERDRENLVVWRAAELLVILNRFPYNNGHLLVAPARHRARLDQLDDEFHAQAMRTIAAAVRAIERAMNAEGFNIGLNLGRVAGAGLPGHLHWHVVPRWNGDTNFMPVMAGVDVIPQSLDAAWGVIRAALVAEQ